MYTCWTFSRKKRIESVNLVVCIKITFCSENHRLKLICEFVVSLFKQNVLIWVKYEQK